MKKTMAGRVSVPFFVAKKTLYKCDFVSCRDSRWVSALINPFPAGDFLSAGILQKL